MSENSRLHQLLFEMNDDQERRTFILEMQPSELRPAIQRCMAYGELKDLAFIATALMEGRDRFCEDCGRSTLHVSETEVKS